MATIQELLDLAFQIRDAEQNGENTALRVGQFLVELVNHFNTKADVDNISGAYHLKQQHAPIMALMSVQQMQDSNGQDNKAWWSTDGHIKYQHNGRIYDLGTPAYMLYYCGDKIYKWTGSATGFKLMTDGGGGSSGGGSSRVLEQRVAIIAEILQNAVFTSDQSQRFEDLAALEDAVDSITLNVSSHTFNGIGGTFILVATTVPSGKSVRWESSNPAVATVDGNGVVTPVSYGSCVITAKAGSNNVAATCSITVQQFQVDSVSIDQNDILLDSVAEGYTKQLTATTMYNGQVVQAGVTWSSSNPSVATVDPNTGLVTVAGNGQTTITATSGTESDTITIRVTGVMQTFHVNVGTLTNVTIEDGQGNAITNGHAVIEGSALTINFMPASSHEISALSVVMGSTTLDETDATDGTGGAKVISIQSVSGDIAVSASATYVEKDYWNDGTDLNSYGVIYNTPGNFQNNSSYKCRIVPLDFGKFYNITADLSNNNGAYNIALVKSDGNGGYTNLINGTDVVPPSDKGINSLTYAEAANIYYKFNSSSGNGTKIAYFPIFDASCYNVDKVYLAITTSFQGAAGISNISIKEFNAMPYTDPNTSICIEYNAYKLNFSSSGIYRARIFEVGFGKTYSYENYAKGNEPRAYNMGIAVITSQGVLRSLEKSEANNISSFFTAAEYVSIQNAPTSGTFTIPSLNDINVDDNTEDNVPITAEKIFFVANILFGTDTVDNSNFTITEDE